MKGLELVKSKKRKEKQTERKEGGIKKKIILTHNPEDME